jgi:hypothetical protein
VFVVLFRVALTGLADGLALKELRYATDPVTRLWRRFAP